MYRNVGVYFCNLVFAKDIFVTIQKVGQRNTQIGAGRFDTIHFFVSTERPQSLNVKIVSGNNCAIENPIPEFISNSYFTKDVRIVSGFGPAWDRYCDVEITDPMGTSRLEIRFH